MIVYLSPFLTFLLLRWGLDRRPRLRGQIYWVLLGGMFLFAGFRFEVGCDWSGYIHHWRIVAGPSYDPLAAPRDLGWWLTVDLLEASGLPYPVLNVVVAAVFFACMHAMAKRQPDPMAFLLVLFPVLVLGMTMAALRQAVAIGFVAMAFMAFADRRSGAFALWLGAGTLFHSSAMVFLPLLPLAGGRLDRWRVGATAALLLPAGLALLSTAAADLAATRYVGTDTVAEGAAYRVALVALTGLFHLIFLRGPWRRAFPGDARLAFVGALLMLGVGLLLPLSTVIADRLSYYLIPLQALIVARVPALPVPSRRLLCALPWIGLVALLAVWLAESGAVQQCYLPYRNWLLGFPDGVRYAF